MKWIDTHSHLYLKQFDEDRQAMVNRALEQGVAQIFLPNIDEQTIDPMLDLCKSFPSQISPMMGLHPCDVKEDFELVLERMAKRLEKEHPYIAIGETGIDLYWDKTTLQIQIAALEIQIQWAKEHALPIVIHARDSYEELFEVFDRLNDDQLTGVFHCFVGSLDQAKHIIDYGGFKLGIGGVSTFKNTDLRETLKEVDLENIVLETDAPFLAPTPHRGKRNESAYIPLIGEVLSGVYQRLPEEIALQTTQNALDLFPKAK